MRGKGERKHSSGILAWSLALRIVTRCTWLASWALCSGLRCLPFASPRLARCSGSFFVWLTCAHSCWWTLACQGFVRGAGKPLGKWPRTEAASTRGFVFAMTRMHHPSTLTPMNKAQLIGTN